jgi:hypothetical protein
MVLQSNPKVGLGSQLVQVNSVSVMIRQSIKAYVRLLLGSTTSTAAGDPVPTAFHPMRFDTGRPTATVTASNTAGQGLLDLNGQELSWRSTTS